MKGINLARRKAQGHHARAAPLLDQEVQEVKLVIKVDLVLDTLLIEGLKDHVARAVGGVTGPPHGSLAEFPGVPAEGPLRDLSLRGAAER